MYGRYESPLVPRNGHTLVVGIVARISGCANQREMSLDDQVDHAKQVLAEMYDGPVEFRVIATKGKGERLDRPELEQIEAELRKDELDVWIMEDLGRVVRGGEAVRLLGIGIDHGTRGISPNDYVDTIEPTWEEDALAACRDHVGHNAHTSKRLKHKLMNRFVKFGGAPAREIAGYIVPNEAKTYDEWLKDEEATPIIQHGLVILKTTRNGEAVAEYFNHVQYKGSFGFPTGPYCRKKQWDGKMVLRFYRNRLLGGYPERGRRHTVKHHESGRRVSVPNSKGPQHYHCPRLAHVDIDELDSVIALVGKANTNFGRKKVNGVDPLFRVARKDSPFPRGPACCWYCGRQSVWGGNGVTEHLMCPGAREWKCWCSIGYDGALTTQRTLQLIHGALQRLEGFDDQFRELVSRARQSGGNLEQRRAKLRQDEQTLADQKNKVQEMIRAVGAKPLVLKSLEEVEAQEKHLAAERRQVDALDMKKLDVPESIGELRRRFEEQCERLAKDSREFNDLVRQLVPEFHVYLVQLLDGGHLLPRARVKLALDGIAPDAVHVPGLAELLTMTHTIDLFDPPQREQIRARAVELTARGVKQRDIAAQLKVTQTAVQKALALHRKMKDLELTEPYVALIQPSDNYSKLRRHRNRKYRFEPLGGYVPPTI
jgi:site-specific DNA recombinase